MSCRRIVTIIGELLLRGLVVAIACMTSRIFTADVGTYFDRAHSIGLGYLPYRDFLWEYPPLSAVPLALIPTVGRSELWFSVLFVGAMVVLEYASLVLLRRLRPGDYWSVTVLWTSTVVPLGSIDYFRLDFIAVFFATLGVVGLCSGRRVVGWVVAGFAAKLWPLVLAGVLFAQRRWRSLSLVVVGCAGLVGAWWAFSPDGFDTFMRFRQGSGFQVESIPGALLMLAGREHSLISGALVTPDYGWEWVQLAMPVVLLVGGGAVVVVAWRRRSFNALALAGVLTGLSLLTSRLLSPQFLVWLAPFVVLLGVRERRQWWLYLVATVLTLVEVSCYGDFLRNNTAVALVVVVRNGVLVALLAEQLRIAFKANMSHTD